MAARFIPAFLPAPMLVAVAESEATMRDLHRQTAEFVARKREAQLRASQSVALQLSCGVDLTKALAADCATRSATVIRLERLVERERLKGQARHWNYDLNRHIALKQAIDLLLDSQGVTSTGAKRRAPERLENRHTKRKRRLGGGAVR